MELKKIAEMISKPQALLEIASSIKNGTCEIKIEQEQLVILQVQKKLRYKN